MVRSSFNKLFSETQLIVEDSVAVFELTYNLQILFINLSLLNAERISSRLLRDRRVSAPLHSRLHMWQLWHTWWLLVLCQAHRREYWLGIVGLRLAQTFVFATDVSLRAAGWVSWGKVPLILSLTIHLSHYLWFLSRHRRIPLHSLMPSRKLWRHLLRSPSNRSRLSIQLLRCCSNSAFYIG